MHRDENKGPVAPLDVKAFLEAHDEIEEMDALWWCERVMADRQAYEWYCCMVFTSDKPQRLDWFRAESGEALAKQLETAGIDPHRNADAITRLCESASGNPKLRRRRKSASV